MRLAFAAGAVCLSLVGIAGQPDPPKKPDPATVAATTTANDDAAKHARRTACLKDAKARKLIGADRSAFLKDCIAAPSAAGT
jgi:psiF repeat